MPTANMYIDITPPTEDRAKVEAIIAPFAEMLGRAPGGLGMLGTSPPVLEHYVHTLRYFLGHPNLSPRLLTFIRYLVSARGDCRYCVDLNEAFLLQNGMDLDAVRATRDNPDLAPLDAREKALLKLALDATDAPHTITAERVESLRAQGWSDRDLFDAAWHATANRAFGRVAEAFGLAPDGYVA